MSITLETLDYQFHSVQIKDANGDALAINGDGSVPITDNGGSLTVDSVDLDIRDLAFATDKVDVSGSEVSLDAATLAALENITVSATDLDIRDLSHSQDSVKVGDGTDFLAVNADGSVNITDNGGSLTVDATDLDIRDLAYATDSVTAHQGGTWSVTATATDFDIRDLSHSQDSVKIGDGTDFLAVNADGSINTVVSGTVSTTPDAFSSWKVSKQAVSDAGASQIAATALTGRLMLQIENLGSNPVYFKNTNAVSTNDFKLSPGSIWEIGLAADATLYAICSTGHSADLRIAEFAA